MCLRLTYHEAKKWKREASEIIVRAEKNVGGVDPLLTAAPELSRIVSVVDSVKKQHGMLIERALLRAINLVSGWVAEKGAIPRANGAKYIPDCYAFNKTASQVYIFECKRNYSFLDGSARRELDDRLDQISLLFPPFANGLGWGQPKIDLYILSFYGPPSGSKYPIVDRHTIDRLFPPCVCRFVRDFINLTERQMGKWASEATGRAPELESQIADRANIFDQLDLLDCEDSAQLEVTAEGLRLVT